MPGQLLAELDGDGTCARADIACPLAQGVEKLQIDRIGHPYVICQGLELVRDPFVKGDNLDLRTLHIFAPQWRFHGPHQLPVAHRDLRFWRSGDMFGMILR